MLTILIFYVNFSNFPYRTSFAKYLPDGKFTKALDLRVPIVLIQQQQKIPNDNFNDCRKYQFVVLFNDYTCYYPMSIIILIWTFKIIYLKISEISLSQQHAYLSADSCVQCGRHHVWDLQVHTTQLAPQPSRRRLFSPEALQTRERSLLFRSGPGCLLRDFELSSHRRTPLTN